MKERLVTLLCALGALAVFFALFLRGDDVTSGRGGVAAPTSEERRANGYHGRWCGSTRSASKPCQFGIASINGLPGPGWPPTGNLLIVTLPALTAFRTEEFRPLDTWCGRGIRCWCLAALSDDPDWAFAAGEAGGGGPESAHGAGVVKRFGGAPRVGSGRDAVGEGRARRTMVGARIAATARAFAQPQPGTLVPNGPHAYFSGVRTAVALSDYPWAGVGREDSLRRIRSLTGA